MAASGFILWKGPSTFDGKPIVVIATGFKKTKNRKTGAMLQIWIIRSDVNPLEAIRYGKDASICGDCKHRPTTEANPNGWGTCYVHVPQAPMGVYRTYKQGLYKELPLDQWESTFDGWRVRFGAYGDPAAAPFDVWNRISAFCDRHTGYTHQWSRCDQRLKGLVMASVDTPAEYERAQALGWRTFRVRMKTEDLGPTERMCPASEEAGKIATCQTCMACHGGSNKKAGISIELHGGNWKPMRFVQIRVLQSQKKAYRPLLAEAVAKRVTKDRYYKKGMRIDVVRDKKGNVVRLVKTPRDLIACT